MQIGSESEVSFATYFNAFPASYWRRWSTLESVVLRVELTGSARVDVYRSKATGARITVGGTEVVSVDADTPTAAEFEIGLDPFEDGGWIWFDITTDTKVTLHKAAWYAPVPAPGRADIAVGIPTFNRPADCVNALRALTSDPLVDEVIGAVIVADQGANKASAHPDFPAAAALLGDRLSIHNQPNLGGSGGYSRVMYEALQAHRLRTDPVHGRRHPHRARLGAAGTGAQPVRQDADPDRRADAQPAGAVAPARHG